MEEQTVVEEQGKVPKQQESSEDISASVPRVELGGNDNSPNGVAAPRGRGRPRKSSTERRLAPASDGPKRGRGRPKGSVNKKPAMSLKVPSRRGRPRKYPLPSSEGSQNRTSAQECRAASMKICAPQLLSPTMFT
uniref:High mobility group AT-hook 1a n=1 Tax=Hippocampus comes TaxID=109280 RepID=A0A3Q2ZBM9_HIPCM